MQQAGKNVFVAFHFLIKNFCLICLCFRTLLQIEVLEQTLNHFCPSPFSFLDLELGMSDHDKQGMGYILRHTLLTVLKLSSFSVKYLLNEIFVLYQFYLIERKLERLKI
jgi:hypothetical protein